MEPLCCEVDRFCARGLDGLASAQDRPAGVNLAPRRDAPLVRSVSGDTWDHRSNDDVDPATRGRQSAGTLRNWPTRVDPVGPLNGTGESQYAPRSYVYWWAPSAASHARRQPAVYCDGNAFVPVANAAGSRRGKINRTIPLRSTRSRPPNSSWKSTPTASSPPASWSGRSTIRAGRPTSRQRSRRASTARSCWAARPISPGRSRRSSPGTAARLPSPGASSPARAKSPSKRRTLRSRPRPSRRSASTS